MTASDPSAESAPSLVDRPAALFTRSPTTTNTHSALRSHSDATHRRLSRQLHRRLVSHLYVAMGTALLVTPHQQRRPQGSVCFVLHCCHGWCVVGWLASARWRAKLLPYVECVCPCVFSCVHMWERGSSKRLADWCQKCLFVENCWYNVSELCGCRVWSQLSERCYLTQPEANIKTEWRWRWRVSQHCMWERKKSSKTKNEELDVCSVYFLRRCLEMCG